MKDYSEFSTDQLIDEMTRVATRISDGHFTIARFTTNWRACFYTPDDHETWEFAAEGKSIDQAIEKALANPEKYTLTNFVDCTPERSNNL